MGGFRMKNKVLISLNEFIWEKLSVDVRLEMSRNDLNREITLTREIWETLSDNAKKELILAKADEVEALYLDAPIIGLYDDIYTSLIEEGGTSKELKNELRLFTDEILFAEYSDNDLLEMIKPLQEAQLDD